MPISCHIILSQIFTFLNKVKEDAKKLPEEGNVEEFKSEVKKDLKKLVKKLGENNNSKK